VADARTVALLIRGSTLGSQDAKLRALHHAVGPASPSLALNLERLTLDHYQRRSAKAAEASRATRGSALSIPRLVSCSPASQNALKDLTLGAGAALPESSLAVLRSDTAADLVLIGHLEVYSRRFESTDFRSLSGPTTRLFTLPFGLSLEYELFDLSTGALIEAGRALEKGRFQGDRRPALDITALARSPYIQPITGRLATKLGDRLSWRLE